MAKETPEQKTTNQILIEQLMLNVGKISAIIEKQGQSIFGQKNLLMVVKALAELMAELPNLAALFPARLMGRLAPADVFRR